ncbi:hypothetical protein Q8A73_003989 [Channa argus]|nr:hypothetical protein Q8A73_003989 [Channa argus]
MGVLQSCSCVQHLQTKASSQVMEPKETQEHQSVGAAFQRGDWTHQNTNKSVMDDLLSPAEEHGGFHRLVEFLEPRYNEHQDFTSQCMSESASEALQLGRLTLLAFPAKTKIIRTGCKGLSSRLSSRDGKCNKDKKQNYHLRPAQKTSAREKQDRAATTPGIWSDPKLIKMKHQHAAPCPHILLPSQLFSQPFISWTHGITSPTSGPIPY